MHAKLYLSNLGLLGTVAASGFTPPEAASLVFWGRADSLAGADTDPIGSFTDLSGNGNHATASGTERPTLQTNEINSTHSVLRFDGTNDFMTWPDILSGVSAGEVFIVLKADAEPAASNTHPLWYLSKTSGVGESAHPFTDSKLYEHFGSDIQVASFEKPSTSAAFHLYNVETASNKMVIRWNGEVIWGQNENSPGFNSAPLLCKNFAATAVWKGDIAEILIYDAVLSESNKKLVNDYLAARYALTVIDITAAVTPANVGTLAGHWKADALALSNDDPVSSWNDESSNNRDLAASLTLRPTFKTNIYNGLPTVRYDGVDDLLALSGTHTIAGAVTFIAVCKQLTGFDNARIFGENTDQQTKVRRGGTDAMNFYPGSSTEIVSTSTWNRATLDTLKFYAWRRNADNTVSFFQNGVEIDTPGSTNSVNYPFLYLGLLFGGDMCEACYYNEALTNMDIASLYYKYFRDKWGLP